MSRLLVAVFVGSLLILGGPKMLSAQDGSYDENALRLEGHRGDMSIVRGLQGTVLARIGGFRSVDVAKLMSPSEKAMAEGKKFTRDYGPGSWLAGLGIATLGAGIGVSQIHDVNRGITGGLIIGGTAVLVYGAGRLENAYNALSRSIWWYNRDLKK